MQIQDGVPSPEGSGPEDKRAPDTDPAAIASGTRSPEEKSAEAGPSTGEPYQ